MFKELFTEGSKKGGKNLTNKPLSDSEIKKLDGYEKRISSTVAGEIGSNSKGRGRKIRTLNKMSREWEDYENLKARSSIPQKTFELITLAQAVKMDNIWSFSGAVRKAIDIGNRKGEKMEIYDAKYLAKNKNLKKEDIPAFIQEYLPKLKKMYSNKKFEEVVRENFFENMRDEFQDLDYSAKAWIKNIINESSLDYIVTSDPYRVYIEQEKSSKSWTSNQGASMNTDTSVLSFEWDGKKYEKEFKGRTSGYWND